MKTSIILMLILFYCIKYSESIYRQRIVYYPGIGKFSTHYFSTILKHLPQSPQKFETRFLLFTRNNPKNAEHINYEIIKNSANFNGSNPTKFIIHGYTDSPVKGSWMKEMKNEYLKIVECNVILVDWSRGCSINYRQAAVNTRVVGTVIGKLISHLQDFTELDLKYVHILGHSLGAHISGFAGAFLNGQIGRITGLDPAGVYFRRFPPEARLDPTDAQFVDVIHTDIKSLTRRPGFGFEETCGHLDFYPNGGYNQPRCNNPVIQWTTSILIHGLKKGIMHLVGCSHRRAIDIYLSSLRQKQGGIAHQCPDYHLFKSGKCADCGLNGEKCALIGEPAIKSQKLKSRTQGTRFYLFTSGKYPFFIKTD